MATEIRESIMLNQEKWRVFELLKLCNHSRNSIRRVGGAQQAFGQNTKALSQWQARYGRLEFNWKQTESFSERDCSVTFEMLEGDFERLEGRLELDGSDAGKETRLGLTLSIDWPTPYLDKQSRESLIRKSRSVVRKFLRQIQRDSNNGPLKPVLQEISLTHLESFFGAPIPAQLHHDYQQMRILAELEQKDIMQVLDFKPPFLKVERIVVTDRSGSPHSSRSLAMGHISEADTRGHYNSSIFLALCGQLMASAVSIHLATLFPNTAPQVIEASGVKPIDLSSATTLLRPSKQGATFFVDSQIVRKKLKLIWTASNIYFGSLHYGIIEDLKFILAPDSILRSVTDLPPPR